MAGRSPRHSQRGQSVRESAADIERYVSRGSNRAFVIVVFFAILALIFFVRLVFLQVILAPEYSAQAQDSRTVGFYVEPRRGTIYDRNGHILAISVDATTVYANPSEIEEPGATSRAIAEALGGKPSDYVDKISNSASPTFSFVARKVDVAKADKLREAELPGIYFLDDTRREYPYGAVGGNVIGACSVAVDEENNREFYEGICGLELYYNTILAGTEGYYEAEIGADGTPIPGGVHVSKKEVEGQDIVISIDIEFQEQLQKRLEDGLKRVGVEDGSAVVMDAKTGEIYAAASYPYFNPADRSEVKEGSMQLKAASNLFEPGSIFKTVSATAILEDEAMTVDDEVDCPSYIEADGYIVTDAHEREDVVYAVCKIVRQLLLDTFLGISDAGEVSYRSALSIFCDLGKYLEVLADVSAARTVSAGNVIGIHGVEVFQNTTLTAEFFHSLIRLRREYFE